MLSWSYDPNNRNYLSPTRESRLINLGKHENRARVHFLHDLKVVVFVTLRAADVINVTSCYNSVAAFRLYLQARNLICRNDFTCKAALYYRSLQFYQLLGAYFPYLRLPDLVRHPGRRALGLVHLRP